MSKPVTAAVVRDYFRADEARMERLSEGARATVAQGARGRLHPEVIKAFNSRRKPQRRYVLGANKVVKAQAAAQRAALAESGVKVGTRGPLPKVSLTSK